MVGASTTYCACCTAGTLVTSSQVPGGNAPATSADSEPGTDTQILPSTSRGARPAETRACMTSVLGTPGGEPRAAPEEAVPTLASRVPGTCRQMPYVAT